MQQLSTNSQLLTTHQAAGILALQPATLKKWRVLGIGPKYLRVGPRAVRYRMSDLKKFLTQAKPASNASFSKD